MGIIVKTFALHPPWILSVYIYRNIFFVMLICNRVDI